MKQLLILYLYDAIPAKNPPNINPNIPGIWQILAIVTLSICKCARSITLVEFTVESDILKENTISNIINIGYCL